MVKDYYIFSNLSLPRSGHRFGHPLKLRPYGGLIGIDNSSLDKYFKSYKILRLHAFLHDASGFVFEYSEKGPGYSYVLPCPVTN